MARARNEVKKVNPDISFGTYTGAWYPSYYEVGVNFASKKYDPSEDFDWATSEYKNYGYAELMDLYTTGNYYYRYHHRRISEKQEEAYGTKQIHRHKAARGILLKVLVRNYAIS